MRKMKDSGIEWIGLIPDDWEITAIKRLFLLNAGATPKSENEENWDGDVVWITPADYKTNDKFVSCGRRNISDVGYASCSTVLVDAGSIIFSKRAPIGSVAINTVPLCTNQGCISCTPYENVNATFYYYAMSIFTEQFELYGSGTTFKEISANNFGDFKLIFPDMKEQIKIAEFLDKKVSEIDKSIADTKATIEDYKKYKQAVITEAVTKGLDYTVPMKDSGIEWIGMIPEKWRMGKIGFCTSKVGSGKTPKGGAEVYSTEGILFLRSQNVYDTGIVIDNPMYITEEMDEDMKNTRVQDQDVLLNITGGSIGRCCVYSSVFGRANVNQHVSIIRVKQNIMLPKFMQYYWLSMVGKTAINLYQTGGNREGMSADAIKNSPIMYCTIDEQQAIIKYLDKKVAEIDSLIASKEALVAELEAYKKSVIYEYVTGKKEVL